MRKKGNIQIIEVSPLTTDLVGVYFTFEGKTYVWQTNSWKRGNEIAYSTNGETYNVSFTIMDDGRNVKNVRYY
jgi:hypothetical protein